MGFEAVGSGELFRAEVALKYRGGLLDVRKLPSKHSWIWVVLAHMPFQLLLRAPANVHSGAANFGTAKWFLVAVSVLQQASFVCKIFVEVIAGMSGTFAPVGAIEIIQILLGRRV